MRESKVIVRAMERDASATSALPQAAEASKPRQGRPGPEGVWRRQEHDAGSRHADEGFSLETPLVDVLPAGRERRERGINQTQRELQWKARRVRA